MDKIKIEEVIETVKQIKDGKEIEKNITKLVRKILPSENHQNQENNNLDNNIIINNHNRLTNNNNLNFGNDIITLNFSSRNRE